MIYLPSLGPGDCCCDRATVVARTRVTPRPALTTFYSLESSSTTWRTISASIDAGSIPLACSILFHHHTATNKLFLIFSARSLGRLIHRHHNRHSPPRAGMSNGGMMAYQAGVSFSSRFASMIPVAGSALLGFWTRTMRGELIVQL